METVAARMGQDDAAGCMAAPEQLPSWSELPADLLQLVGARFTCPQHIDSASRVCRQWQAIPHGVQTLELDMHPEQQAWQAKVQQLGRAVPSLSRCKAHVSSAVPTACLASNIRQLARQLHNIQHLDLQLAEGCELALADGDGLGNLSALRSLTLSGGTFRPPTGSLLLGALAAACPQLEELRLLPQALCGLGDDEVDALLQLSGLQVLEFRTHRLTAAGLTRLAAGLPRLRVLSCHGLDAALDAAAAAVFGGCPSLAELHLGCDYELPEDAMRQLRLAGGLSMKFRWTDKLAGLLRTARLHLQASLVRLDLGCVRLAADPGPSLMEPLAALTALSDLRMSVYSNQDDTLTLHLSQLAELSNLQVLHLAKQHAYFPEHRRMAESSIAVPLCAASAATLAAGCRRLRCLRLSLGASDITPSGLAALRQLSGLRSLAVNAEPFGSPLQPVPLDLLNLPPGLTSLELRNVDITTPAQHLLADATGTPATAASSGQSADAGSSASGSSSNSSGRPCPLRQLVVLKLESCRLRTPQLQALSLTLPCLQRLKLSHVAGLCDAGVACLARLTGLLELAVLAPHNRQLTQRPLAALATLRELRYLTWQSDDLTALGPVIDAYTSFTTLRSLSLSCSPATLAHACGGDRTGGLTGLLPYCSLDTFSC